MAPSRSRAPGAPLIRRRALSMATLGDTGAPSRAGMWRWRRREPWGLCSAPRNVRKDIRKRFIRYSRRDSYYFVTLLVRERRPVCTSPP